MYEVRTERLALRRARPADFHALRDIYGRPEVARMVASWPIPPDDALIRDRCNPYPAENGIVGVVERGGEVIGSMGVTWDGPGTMSLGYGFHPDHWGRGYATEMGRALIEAVFSRFDADRLTAGHFLDNPASGRVLEKLGFRKGEVEARFSAGRREKALCRGWELTRADWLATNPLRIETERLVIRPYQGRDVIAFQAIAGRRSVARNMASIPFPFPQKEAADWLARRAWRGRPGFCVGVFGKDGALLGTLGLGGEPLSVMYFVDPGHWGEGIATEALAAFLQDARRRYALEEITAGAMADNPASQRVLEKLGFQRVGERRCTSPARVEPVPEYLYRLGLEGFEALP